MVSVAVKLLTGRYHATPWGRHVNEGVPEWPPSPWRLLRALVAAGKRMGMADDELRQALYGLVQPPAIRLPPGAPVATRHYMPQYRSDAGKTVLVMDNFMAVGGDAEVRFTWSAELADKPRQTLKALLEQLPYLGRAESWCDAYLVDAGEERAPNCVPVEAVVHTVIPDADVVPVLCADPSTSEDLLDCLLVSTMDLRDKQKRNLPPGAVFVPYARDPSLWQDHPVSRHPHRQQRVSGVRYRLSAVPLPPITSAVDVGDRARLAAMFWYSKLHNGPASEVLCGHDGTQPSRRPGGHARYLATDDDGDGRLDHLTICFEGELAPAEVEALRSMRRLWSSPGGANRAAFDIDLLLVDMFNVGDARVAPVFSAATTWRSVTPFLLTRHPKTYHDGRPKLGAHGRQKDGPEDQLRREWDLLHPEGPEIASVRFLPWHQPSLSSRRFRWTEFRRWRRTGSSPAVATPYGMEITFHQPATGPIALGYGSHYGLGLFMPADAAVEQAANKVEAVD